MIIQMKPLGLLPMKMVLRLQVVVLEMSPHALKVIKFSHFPFPMTGVMEFAAVMVMDLTSYTVEKPSLLKEENLATTRNIHSFY